MAKPLRLALGACIIQAEYGYSDEETALQIQENPYLQYFCGYPGYDDEKLPFDPSLMVYFRKRLTPEVLGEINEMIVRDAKERQVKEAESKDDDDDSDGQSGTGGNSGTMIVDATCAPSNIRYPQDVSLLNEARENAETLLDVLHDPADGKKPRTYRKRARKDYLKYTRCRKHTAKMTRKAIGKQLTYLFPAQLWGGPRRVKPETRLRTIGMSASAWKWSADSLWRSVNVAWGWSPQSCGRLRPM